MQLVAAEAGVLPAAHHGRVVLKLVADHGNRRAEYGASVAAGGVAGAAGYFRSFISERRTESFLLR